MLKFRMGSTLGQPPTLYLWAWVAEANSTKSKVVKLALDIFELEDFVPSWKMCVLLQSLLRLEARDSSWLMLSVDKRWELNDVLSLNLSVNSEETLHLTDETITLLSWSNISWVQFSLRLRHRAGNRDPYHSSKLHPNLLNYNKLRNILGMLTKYTISNWS